jgi:hypothetical protein
LQPVGSSRSSSENNDSLDEKDLSHKEPWDDEDEER